MNAEQIRSSKLSHKCLIRLQSIYSALKSAEKKAADYVMKYPERVAGSSIAEAANLAGCSEATFIRLAKNLGYSGFPELKSALVRRADEQIQTSYGVFNSNDDEMAVATEVFRTSVQTLNDTLGMLDPVQYNEAVNIMLNAQRYVFLGAGDAYPVAYASFLKFFRMGFSSSCNSDYDLQLIDTTKLDENGVLIVFSHSGQTKTIYEVMKCAKNNKAKIIAITNYPLSPIGKLASVVLQTAAFTPDKLGEIITKRIPELCIIESIYMNILIRMNLVELDNFKSTYDNLSINKM